MTAELEAITVTVVLFRGGLSEGLGGNIVLVSGAANMVFFDLAPYAGRKPEDFVVDGSFLGISRDREGYGLTGERRKIDLDRADLSVVFLGPGNQCVVMGVLQAKLNLDGDSTGDLVLQTADRSAQSISALNVEWWVGTFDPAKFNHLGLHKESGAVGRHTVFTCERGGQGHSPLRVILFARA